MGSRVGQGSHCGLEFTWASRCGTGIDGSEDADGMNGFDGVEMRLEWLIFSRVGQSRGIGGGLQNEVMMDDSTQLREEDRDGDGNGIVGEGDVNKGIRGSGTW